MNSHSFYFPGIFYLWFLKLCLIRSVIFIRSRDIYVWLLFCPQWSPKEKGLGFIFVTLLFILAVWEHSFNINKNLARLTLISVLWSASILGTKKTFTQTCLTMSSVSKKKKKIPRCLDRSHLCSMTVECGTACPLAHAMFLTVLIFQEHFSVPQSLKAWNIFPSGK